MPKVTLQFDENTIPSGVKAFASDDYEVEVWVGESEEKVAAELNPGLVSNRDALKAEKDNIKAKYDALLQTSSADDKEKAKLLAAAEAKAQNALSDADKAILDAVKTADPNATPDTIKESIAKYPQAQTKLAEIEKKEADSKFFAATGYKSEKAFHKAINDKDANPKLVRTEVETVREGDKTISKPVAIIKNDKGTEEKIAWDVYVKDHADWDVYQPSLMAENGNGGQQWLSGTPAQQSSTTLPASTGNSNPHLDAMAKGMAVANAPKPAATAEGAKT